MADAGWCEVPMRDVMAEFYDGPHATPPPASEGPVYLGIKNFTESGHLDLTDVRHLSEADYPKWTSRVEPRPGDIVFTYEATLHRYAIIPAGFRGSLGRRVALIRPDTSVVDTRFLHYAFLSPQWRRTVEQRLNVGSTVDRIPLSEFPTYPLRIPNLQYQHQVVAVLDSVDELVRNNRRRVEMLHEAIRLLFHEWVTRFRFPGHVEAEVIGSDLGPVPNGWSVLSIAQLQSSDRNATTSGPFGSKLGRKDYQPAPGVPVIRGSNLTVQGGFIDDGFVFVSEEKAAELASSVARPSDVVVTQRGTLGQVGLIPKTARFSQYVLSQSQMKFTANPGLVDPLIVYLQLASTEGARRLVNMATGAGVPHINLAMFREMTFVVPPGSIQRALVDVLTPRLELADNLVTQNSVLGRLRNLLLPRLVSGEIDISDLDLAPVA